ncbi:unnamed protein product [Orchesella dallaii]|uniref:Uncharacterized protein n=1 Tax=Orchesella dallaii TaxID=48710 RepID=A0ABP1Q2G8_9HEXA
MWLEFELLNLRAGFTNYVNLLNGGTVMVFILVLLFSKFWARKLKITEGRRPTKPRTRSIPGPGHRVFGRVANVLAVNNERYFERP